MKSAINVVSDTISSVHLFSLCLYHFFWKFIIHQH